MIVILFTWFGRNWKRSVALLRAVPECFARAAGQGHQKPFWYYGQLLAGGWSGGLLVALACLGLFIASRKRDASAYRLLAYYALIVAAIYSLIPYKTPWLALNLWLPLRSTCGDGSRVALAQGRKARFGGALPFLPSASPHVAGVLIAHDTRQRVFLASSRRKQSLCLCPHFGRHARAAHGNRRAGAPGRHKRRRASR